MKNGYFYILATLLTVAANTHATVQKLHVDSGSTKFLAIGRPSLLKIHGVGSGPKGDLTVADNVVSGQLEMQLDTLKTGVDMRDNHMKNKYLEVGKFPKATLTLSGVKIPAANEMPKEVPFEGTLTLHGQTQPIKNGTVKLSKAGDKITFNAKFQTTITGFNIEIPSYAGIKVAENIDVEVDSEATGK